MDLTTRDIQLILERLRANFTPEQITAHGWDKLPADHPELRQALGRIDLEFFSRFYLPHHFTSALAPFHQAMFEDIEQLVRSEGRQNLLEIVFRGAGKSTIDTLATPLWCICYGLRHYIPIISDSLDQAKERLQSIKAELESNERILEDFGDLRGARWQEEEIETANFIKIKALGQGMKFRGRKYLNFRPDLIILDDIEDKKDVQSEGLRKDLEDWFKSTVMRLGWKDTKILVVGNYLHHECLLKTLAKNPTFKSRVVSVVNRQNPLDPESPFAFATRNDLWETWKEIFTDLANPNADLMARHFYEEHEAEMLEGVSVAWPEAYPYYDLMVMRVSMGEAAFATEMLNDPDDPEDRFFRHYGTFRRQPHRNEDGAYEEWLVPWNPRANDGRGGPSGRAPVPLSECVLFAATDPSMGENMRADPSAILIGARSPAGQMFILEADIARRPPDRIISDQIRWFQQYPQIVRWGVETVQFQKFFKSEAARRSLEQGVPIPFAEIANAVTQKPLRIESLEPDLANEYILLNQDGQDTLKEQINRYRPGMRHGKVDGLDALEMLRTLAQDWRPISTANIAIASAHQFNASSPDPFEDEDPYEALDALADDEIKRQKALEELERARAEGRPPKLSDAPVFPVYF
jgi:predicted phage terminase large subunit-like protein